MLSAVVSVSSWKMEGVGQHRVVVVCRCARTVLDIVNLSFLNIVNKGGGRGELGGEAPAVLVPGT